MANVKIEFVDDKDGFVDIKMSGDSPGGDDVTKMTPAQQAAYLVIESLASQLAAIAEMGNVE